MQLVELATRFELPRPDPDGSLWVLCPVHRDGQKHGRQSLHLTATPDGGILVHCFAGCHVEDILARIGHTVKDLMPPKAPRATGGGLGPEVARWHYVYRDGRPAYDTTRHVPKEFRPWLPGATAPGIGDTPRVLYHLDRLKEWARTSPLGRGWIAYVEGEKCADALVALGIPATTHMGGTGGWRKFAPAYLEQIFRSGVWGIVLLADEDPGGRELMAEILASGLAYGGLEFKWPELPGLPEKGDIVDWLGPDPAARREAFLQIVDASPVLQEVPQDRADRPGRTVSPRPVSSHSRPAPGPGATLQDVHAVF